MQILARALSLRRLTRESPAVRLLGSRLAPVILAIVAEHFPSGTRARPAAELYELMAGDFKILKSEGFDLPRTPQEYCNDWVKAGWLVRKSGSTYSGETLEPSEDTLAALDVMERWEQPRSSVTASRIESISQSLHTLARDTDPDISSRLERLEREREQIDQQIVAVSRGEFDLLTSTQIAERVTDILDAASNVPADFARVRHELETLNRSLRRQLLDPEGTRGDVLDEVFRGVDVIGESDAGRSFNGFYSVLVDQERSAHLDSWIDQILTRPEAAGLPAAQRTKLRRLFRDMEDAGFEVNAVMTGLARSLRHYVTSEQFAEDRRMIELLRETRAVAAEAASAADLHPIHQMATPLTRIGMTVGSVSSIRLANPGEELVDEPPVAVDAEVADEAELLAQVRESEIDLPELIDAVRASVDRHGGATVGSVLVQHPPTQGLASVVGLLYLALRHGVRTGEETGETISWDEDGVRRTARIPSWFFDRSSVEEMQ